MERTLAGELRKRAGKVVPEIFVERSVENLGQLIDSYINIHQLLAGDESQEARAVIEKVLGEQVVTGAMYKELLSLTDSVPEKEKLCGVIDEQMRRLNDYLMKSRI